MKFTVKGTDNNSIDLSESALYDLLASKIDAKNPRKEFDAIIKQLLLSLDKAKVITPILNMNIIQNIVYIAFSLGYYYRIFLEKNTVETEEENNVAENSEEQSI